jgi:hypothetical protein
MGRSWANNVPSSIRVSKANQRVGTAAIVSFRLVSIFVASVLEVRVSSGVHCVSAQASEGGQTRKAIFLCFYHFLLFPKHRFRFIFFAVLIVLITYRVIYGSRFACEVFSHVDFVRHLTVKHSQFDAGAARV